MISKSKSKMKTKTKAKVKKAVKREAKASVFTHLFTIPKYMRELYLCFHPEDKDIKESELKDVTIASIFTNIQVNDLGIIARDILLILAEAQSVWTLNILPRTIGYLAESNNRYVQDTNQNIYGTKKVTLPRPELYVIYTGNKNIKQKEISLRKDFFEDETYPIEVEIKVITIKNATKIVKEYIKFTRALDSNNKKYGYTKKSIQTTIDECIKQNILKEYLMEYKKEVYNIMTSVYDQKTATEMYGREQYAEGRAEGMAKGRAEGMAKGRAEGMLESFLVMIRKGLVKIADAAKELGMSPKELARLV